MIHYDVSFTPEIIGFYQSLTHIKPIKKAYWSLFGKKDENNKPVLESTNYDPSIGDMSSPTSSDYATPVVDLNNDLPDNLLDNWDRPDDDTEVFQKEFDELIFSDGEEYEVDKSLFESATGMDLPVTNEDANYGIPRLQLFPLDSMKNTIIAVRNETVGMLPSDRVVFEQKLAEACEKYGVKNEARSQHKVKVYGITDSDKKLTKEDVIKEHLKANDLFYNNLMYSPKEYLDGLKKSARFPTEIGNLLNHFYPSFKIHTFVSRSCSAVGGLFEGDNQNAFNELYNKYKAEPEKYEEDLKEFIAIHYEPSVNWYKVKHENFKHILLAAEVTMLINRILNCQHIPDNAIQIAYDWETAIKYHHAIMEDSPVYSKMYFWHAQALHDLYWDPLDNPDDPDDCASAKLSFLAIIPDQLASINETNSGEMICKEDLAAWLQKELDPDVLKSYYLLPDKEEYLILSPKSIKYAMDYITQVPEEDRDEYAENLNRLYYKFMNQCNFKISIDHPYAKYLNAGKYKINPEQIVVNILEGVVEDKSFDAAHKQVMPQSYRIVDLFYQDGIDTVTDLDPDHNKNKAKIITEAVNLATKPNRGFPKVKEVVDSLNNKELNYICGGEFKDSKRVLYRFVESSGSKTVGFIDCYRWSSTEARIVLAVNPDFRGKGIAKKLVNTLIRNFKDDKISTLIWEYDIDNISSKNLAKSFGFVEVGKTDNKTGKMILNVGVSKGSSDDTRKADMNEAVGTSDSSDNLGEIVKMNRMLNKFEYGLSASSKKGIKTNATGKEYDNKYRLATPEQFLKQEGGVCWDFAAYEAYHFKKYAPSLKYTAWYIVFDAPPYYPTHTFITVKVGNNYVLPESSFRRIQGVWVSKSETDLVNFIIHSMSEHTKDLLEHEYALFKYNALDRKTYGMGSGEFMNYIEKVGKEVHFKYNPNFDVTKLKGMELDEAAKEAHDLSFHLNGRKIEDNKTCVDMKINMNETTELEGAEE